MSNEGAGAAHLHSQVGDEAATEPAQVAAAAPNHNPGLRSHHSATALMRSRMLAKLRCTGRGVRAGCKDTGLMLGGQVGLEGEG